MASIAHVAVARYDLIAYDLVTSIGQGGDDEEPEATDGAALRPADRRRRSPTADADADPTAEEPTAAPSTPTWDGKKRLNILLVGSDKRGDQTSYNTDTMIVASIDPVTKQVAMLSLPRDTVNVPLPRQWRAYGFYGGVYPAKINSLWARAQAARPTSSPATSPGSAASTPSRAPSASCYQIDIPYYIEVDFDGFKKVVDTFGGRGHRCPDAGRRRSLPDRRRQLLQPLHPERLPAHGRDAGARLRAGPPQDIRLRPRPAPAAGHHLAPPAGRPGQPPRAGQARALVSTLKSSIHTDIPAELFPALVSLAGQVDAKEVRSLVFTPPTYQVECLSCYSLTPKVKAIRRAVKEVFTVDRAFEQARVKVGEEGAVVWVLNGSGISGQAAAIADYLDYLGVNATCPPRAAAGPTGAPTRRRW